MSDAVNTSHPIALPRRRARRTAARALAVALPLALVAAACGDDTVEEPAGGSAASVEGRTWLSTGSSGFEIVEESVIRLTFDAGTLSANAGCNSMNGGYTLDGDVLKVSAMASTQMACDEALMDQDSRLSELLTSSPTVAVDGDGMVLTSGDASITFLDRVVADPDRPLEGTEWTLTSIISNEAISSLPADAEASMTITDGQAAVATGCNRGSAGVTIEGDTIEFGPMALTKMMCTPELMDLETQVTTVLQGTVTFSIEAGTLTLTNGDNGLVWTAPAA